MGSWGEIANESSLQFCPAEVCRNNLIEDLKAAAMLVTTPLSSIALSYVIEAIWSVAVTSIISVGNLSPNSSVRPIHLAFVARKSQF